MGKLISKPNPAQPKTIAEAKAEISEVLQKIKEHYEAINKLRLADRTKWKYFNKKVEELEVVKASALKQERKRQGDCERTMVLNQLEASKHFKEIQRLPKNLQHVMKIGRLRQANQSGLYRLDSGFSADITVVWIICSVKTEGRKTTTSSEERNTKSVEKTDSHGDKQDTEQCDPHRSKCYLEEQNCLSTALSLPGVDKKSDKVRTKNEEQSLSALKNKEISQAKSNAKAEELFVQIDMPMNVRKTERRDSSCCLHVAKLVSVPMHIEYSESDTSELTSSSSLQQFQSHKQSYELPPTIAGISSPDQKTIKREGMINRKEEVNGGNRLKSRSKTEEFIESISLSEEHQSLRNC
ncbi:hypothetical protein DICVIV_01636 [Dictyocaulus viviparus]|uniref:Uncharacterized protein n=1 Tax=Dictyocaulus viviparus TaxID=29172 RepID=A0A0D8YC90_DICVI|nr:hypothetical protein DICVIV_01636 [Dictyocaulus viviparus]